MTSQVSEVQAIPSPGAPLLTNIVKFRGTPGGAPAPVQQGFTASQSKRSSAGPVPSAELLPVSNEEVAVTLAVPRNRTWPLHNATSWRNDL